MSSTGMRKWGCKIFIISINLCSLYHRQIVVDPSVLSIDEEDGEAVCEEFPYLHDDIDSSDEDWVRINNVLDH